MIFCYIFTASVFVKIKADEKKKGQFRAILFSKFKMGCKRWKLLAMSTRHLASGTSKIEQFHIGSQKCCNEVMSVERGSLPQFFD